MVDENVGLIVSLVLMVGLIAIIFFGGNSIYQGDDDDGGN